MVRLGCRHSVDDGENIFAWRLKMLLLLQVFGVRLHGMFRGSHGGYILWGDIEVGNPENGRTMIIK